jgi:hypothetical protein
VEPRSVLEEEDSTVPSEAIAVVICGSHESAGNGDVTSLSGGAFSHFSCDAMTSWMAEATVCEGWLKVPGRMISIVLSSVIATILGVCFECTDWDNFPRMRGLPEMRAVSVALEVSAARGLVFSFCWKLPSCSPPMLSVASLAVCGNR